MIRHAALFFGASAAACSIPEYHYPPGPPSIARFEITPFEATRGETVTARWRVTGADEITLRGAGEDRSALDAEGTLPLVLDADLELELVAKSSAGITRAIAAARLFDPQPVRITRFEVAPLRTRPTDPVRVTWETENASQLAVSLASGVTLEPFAPPQGSLIVRSQLDFTVKLRAEGFQGPALAEQSVEVREPAPLVVRFEAQPDTVDPSGFAAVAWEVLHAQHTRIDEEYPDGAINTLIELTTPAGQGSLPLDVSRGSRVLVLHAENGGGAVTERAQLFVRDTRMPEILAFTATPTITGPGGAVRAEWSTHFASSVDLQSNGFSFPEVLPVSGALSFDVLTTSNLVLIARSEDGRTAIGDPLPIEVDLRFPSIALSTPSRRMIAGELARIEWSSSRADRIVFTNDAGETLLASTAPSGVLTFPARRSVVISAAAENAFGTTLQHQAIDVDVAPRILSFTASSTLARAYRPVVFRWQTASATHGTLRFEGNALELGSEEIARGERVIGASPTSTAVRYTLEADSTLFSATATIGVGVLEAATGFTEDEPDETRELANGTYSATPIATVHGNLEGPSDVDMYAVSGPFGARITATTFPPSGCVAPVALDVYEEDGQLRFLGPIVSVEPAADCAAIDPATHPALALLGTNLVLALRPGPGASGFPIPYELVARFDPGACGDGILDRGEECDDGNLASGDGCSLGCFLEALDELEPNETMPNTVPTRAAFRAFLNDDDVDLFQFEILLGEEGPAMLILESPAPGACTLNARLSLFDVAFNELATDEGGSGACPLLAGAAVVLGPGSYYAVISAGLEAGALKRGPYTLTISPP